MAVSIIPKQSSEPEFEVFEYEYTYGQTIFYPDKNTFPNGTPTKSSFGGNYDTDDGYGITADVSKSGYTIAGILDAYGSFSSRTGSSSTAYPTTESFLDGNTLKMKTRGTFSSWNSWRFCVKVKYVKN